jgi:hypothetical protein
VALASGLRLPLATDAGLLVTLAALDLGQDTCLLDLLLETLQSALDRLIFANADFCQTIHPLWEENYTSKCPL